MAVVVGSVVVAEDRVSVFVRPGNFMAE